MTHAYQPRAGSAGALVLAHLQEHGGSLTSEQIAALIDKETGSISTLLKTAVREGVLVVEGVRGSLTYSLPEPVPPADGPLRISTWDDGDVVVAGGVINEDGSVTYTREQMAQLVKRMTTPHVQGLGSTP